MAVDYYYSWDSIIGTFHIHHQDGDYWALYLDDDFILQTGSPQSAVIMLEDGLEDVNWGEEDPDIPDLDEWAVVSIS